MTLRRLCGCGEVVRGKCPRCQARRNQAKDQAKRARRPDLNRNAEIQRRRRAVADHRANVGDWCPGWERQPAHPAANLQADHVIEVAAGGLESGPLVVRCGSCNSARSANVGRLLTSLLVTTPLQADHAITHLDDGPVVA